MADVGDPLPISDIDGLNQHNHPEDNEEHLVARHWFLLTLSSTWAAIRFALHVSQNPIRWLLCAYFAWIVLSETSTLTNMNQAATGWLASSRITEVATVTQTIEVVDLAASSTSNVIPYPRPQETVFSPNFRKLIELQSPLQGAMENSVNAQKMVVNIKRSEMAVRDLSVLVTDSELISKNILSQELLHFVRSAKITGRSLQKFGGRAKKAFSQTIGMNEFAIGLLENVAKQDSSLSLSSSRITPSQRDGIKIAWFEAVDMLKLNVKDLTEEAVHNLDYLDDLKIQMDVIHDIVVREGKEITRNKAEMLGHLWTMLGGNKDHLASFEFHTELLNNVLKLRDDAQVHVTGALIQLRQITEDLEDLDEQLMIPLLRGKAAEIPLHAHISVMMKGTARLTEAQTFHREREYGR